jgi:hypothetical protein
VIYIVIIETCVFSKEEPAEAAHLTVSYYFPLLDEFTGPLETLNGASILGRVEFRKILADDAFIGQKDNHTYGTKYPTDVICDNGVIHAIKHVLTPGYQPPSNPWTGNDSASTPWASGRQA